MKEMIKQKMMKRLHRRDSSTSTTSSSSISSVDHSIKSGERFEFQFSSLQALQVPRGWDKLSLSLISVETGKTISKTGKASVWNGNCRWTETLSESVWISNDDCSKELEQCLYKLIVSMGSARSGILGEVTVDLSGHLSSETSTPSALPLKNCNHGTILQVGIQCLTPRAKLRNDRWGHADSFLEGANTDYDDLDNTSDVSDGRITKSLGSSTSNNFLVTSPVEGIGSRETSLSAGGSHHSFDSMEDSFGRESSSPYSNTSEVVNDPCGSPNVSYRASPTSSHSRYSSGSGKHIQNKKQDSWKVSHSIPSSPLRTLASSEFVLEAEELRAEARMWETNARKLMLDLDVSRKESKDHKRNLEKLTTELSALQTECDGLKQEIKHLKVLLGESAVKEKAADSLKLQVQDKNDIQTELEEEIKFQKDLNDNLALQLNKTQESNLELVSVLQELEETIEKQRLEMERLSELKLQDVDTDLKLNCELEDDKEIYTREHVSASKMVSYDSDDDSSTGKPNYLFMQGEHNDKWKLEVQLQQSLESQRTMESTILYLEKTLEEKTQVIENERDLKTRSLLDIESEWREKLGLKEKEIFHLEEKLSEALSAQVPEETQSQAAENRDLMEEVKALRDKVQELERDCNELTDENLELLFKLKESNKDLSVNGSSASSLDRRPTTELSPTTDDSELSKLERQTWQLKEDAKKRESDGQAAGYLQVRCNYLESKCTELEVQMQDFKDRACYLGDELEKYRAKAEDQENEIAALNQLVKCQQDGTHENSCIVEVLDELVSDNVLQPNRSLENHSVPEATAHYGEEEIKLMINDPYVVEDEMRDNNGDLMRLNMELKSKIEDLDKQLLAKTSEVEVLKSDCFLKEQQIASQMCFQRDLEAQLSDLQMVKNELEESLESMQRESKITSECLDKVKSDMEVLNGTKDSHISASKILEKKVLELQSSNQELELHVSELEEENLHLSERISGLEPQLRYLTDAREASRLDAQHSDAHVANLQAEIRRLEHEIEAGKIDMRQKLQDMQNRWLEAQEECEYLKKANPKLQATAENLIEECSSLQKSNGELKQQRLELHNHCTVLEADLHEARNNFSKLSEKLEELEGKFTLMLDEIASKERMFDSELDALRLQNKEQTQKLVMDESLLNQMYLNKVVEVENLQQEVEHLSAQMSATHDERDRMASDAVFEMHVLRADKEKLEKAIEDIQGKLRSSEMKLETVQVECETKILELTGQLAASKQSHEALVAKHEKLMRLLENSISSEEKLKSKVGELDANLKSCEYLRVQLTEEISSLKVQLQKIPLLQDEVLALKNSLNDVKFENERLEASLQLISGDYEELKEEKNSLFQKNFSMQKAVIELEDHKRSMVALEEKFLRLQGDLTAREAICAQDAELKNELGRMKRSNSQLQWKINCLQEERDECMKKAQALEEQMAQKKVLKPGEYEHTADPMALSFGSHSARNLHEDMKLSEYEEAGTAVDTASRIQSLEIELAEALEANDMYKSQLKSFLSEEQVHQSDVPVKSEVDDKAVDEEQKHRASLLESELRELQERYLHMSLKYAQVEAQREELVLKLKAVSPGRSWFS